MALSNKFGALVLTTGNKSEMSTGSLRGALLFRGADSRRADRRGQKCGPGSDSPRAVAGRAQRIQAPAGRPGFEGYAKVIRQWPPFSDRGKSRVVVAARIPWHGDGRQKLLGDRSAIDRTKCTRPDRMD